MKKFFKSLGSDYSGYVSVLFLLLSILTYLATMLSKSNFSVFAAVIGGFTVMTFVLSKDFMEVKALNQSY